MAAPLKTLAKVTVATAGTRVVLTATAVNNVLKLFVSSPDTNTGSVWVGDANTATGRGIEVPRGQCREISLDGRELLDLASMYVDADNNGDEAAIAYLTKV